jgi:hypothetical protein
MPTELEYCNTDECPKWIVGEWSKCPRFVACDFGEQNSKRYRSVYCSYRSKQVSKSLCPMPAPLDYDECPKPVSTATSTQCGQWRTTDWSTCSVSCGKGIKTRRVYCEADNRQRRHQVDEIYCNKRLKPFNISECVLKEKCPEWIVSSWSSCIGDCTNGTGFKTRNVYCSEKSSIKGDEKEDEFLCSYVKKPSMNENCTKSCNGIWKTGEWSEVINP